MLFDRKDIKIINPHHTPSREVTEKDYKRVAKAAPQMVELCRTTGYALAHAQVEDKDPLRFFVTNEGEIVMNPKITRHLKTSDQFLEGCLSFPGVPHTVVERYRKCEVSGLSLNADTLEAEPFNSSLSGIEARVYQHEIDHMDGKNIYDKS